MCFNVSQGTQKFEFDFMREYKLTSLSREFSIRNRKICYLLGQNIIKIHKLYTFPI